MLEETFDVIKKSQIKRNVKYGKIVDIEARLEDIDKEEDEESYNKLEEQIRNTKVRRCSFKSDCLLEWFFNNSHLQVWFSFTFLLQVEVILKTMTLSDYNWRKIWEAVQKFTGKIKLLYSYLDGYMGSPGQVSQIALGMYENPSSLVIVYTFIVYVFFLVSLSYN